MYNTHMRRKLFFIAIFLVIVFLAWAIFAKDDSKVVEISTVSRGTVTQELVLSGDIRAKQHSSLQFASSGELSYLGVKAGDNVQKGQVLARLDLTSLWANVQKADANFRSAQATLNRVYDQVQGHENDENFTQIEMRTAAETAKDAAYFALVQAKDSYSNALINAPFNGVVTYVANVSPGMTVSPNQTQIELVNPETIYFTVYADQADIPFLYEGQPVEITIDSFPDKPIEGKVVHIPMSPSPQEVGVIYAVEVSINPKSQENQIYRIGMTGDASFVIDSVENTLYVPPQYLKRDSNGQYLTTDGGEKIYVEIGIEGEDRVEVIGNIKEGLSIYD